MERRNEGTMKRRRDLARSGERVRREKEGRGESYLVQLRIHPEPCGGAVKTRFGTVSTNVLDTLLKR